jgi:hypothetical protein
LTAFSSPPKRLKRTQKTTTTTHRLNLPSQSLLLELEEHSRARNPKIDLRPRLPSLHMMISIIQRASTTPISLGLRTTLSPFSSSTTSFNMTVRTAADILGLDKTGNIDKQLIKVKTHTKETQQTDATHGWN